jgi:hypothetical protein
MVRDPAGLTSAARTVMFTPDRMGADVTGVTGRWPAL